MDQVSPDLLLMIFKKLNSKEMVSVMRVERKWLQIIDENQALWRELVLPSKDFYRQGWGLQALELFDQKSNSGLKRVSMDVASEVEGGLFVKTLERSKDTLEILELPRYNRNVRQQLSENLWKFPNLVDCRLTKSQEWYCRLRIQLDERDEDQEDDEGPGLKVLWIANSKELSRSHLYLFDSLVSLLLEDEDYDSLEMRNFLERPSRTLKHLQLYAQWGEEPQLSTLSFPNLKFLDLYLDCYSSSVFPSWMRLPSLSNLIIYNSRILSSLPACSKLWLVSLDEFEDLSELATQCPQLIQLSLNLNGRGVDTSMELSAWERFENLSSMLSQRKGNVEAGMEIGGVKMISLKTLVIPFEYLEFRGENGLKEVGLSKLRESVGEVVDLSEKIFESSEIIEMEV